MTTPGNRQNTSYRNQGCHGRYRSTIMDITRDARSCRLCGVQIVEGRCVHIFDDSTTLVEKIKETLPISVSRDDGDSSYICIPCHDQVILHYKFIQDILRHTGSYNKTEIKLPNEVPTSHDASKAQIDATYTCPNCNMDLIFFIVNESDGNDYPLKMCLAMVDRPDKPDQAKEENHNEDDNIACPKDINTNESSKVIKKESFLYKTEKDSDDSQNGDHIGISIQLANDDVIYIETPPNSENSSEQIQQSNDRKLLDVNSDEQGSETKLRKVEIMHDVPNPNFVACMDAINDKGSIDFMNETSMEDVDGIQEDISMHQDEDMFQESYDTNFDDIIKPGPRIICELCGARYLSQLKFEFHMERHSLNKMDKFECTVCDKEASTENLLWDHYYHTHKSLMRYVCEQCGKMFTKKSRLTGHQKGNKHAGIKQIHLDTATNELTVNPDDAHRVITVFQGKASVNCKLCGKLITDLDPDAINDLVTCATCEDSTLSLVVDGNETKVISPRQYHCSKCPKHFVRKERLEFHEMRHNENMNEFICSTCGKEFSAENSLYEHYMFVHKGARPHICELCGKSFQLKARLKEHHRTHTGEKPYQCDICGQRCRTTYALKIHRKIHFSDNRYTCNICNKTFSKKQNMNEHLEKHWKHDKSVTLPQLFTCPICFEDLPTYRMLKHHMIGTHKINTDDPILTEQKPWYECSDCHEKFKHQMSLKAHRERVHEGRINPIYQCDTCGTTFRIKQLLVNHIKSKHDGEKRYKCAQCKKGFNDTKSLYNHVLLHTGKKPYICEFCNMSFRRKDSRDHHRRKHTGEQPYQCRDCNECFSTYNNRSKHRKRVHGDGDIECPECGERCSGQQEIRVHLNKHLGEKLQQMKSTDDFQ